jgi:hypothetical protein
VGSSGCGAGAVPSKQAKQTSKGLVFDAVRVWWRCGSGAVLNKQARISKGLVLGAGARVQGCGLISRQGLGAGLSAVR